MISYISADYVFPVTEPPIKGGVIGMEDDGLILAVLSPEEAKAQQITDVLHYEGLLVPGFVNTHCHLELSHLRGRIEQHTGLIGFVQEVMKMRGSDEYSMVPAMLDAEREMFENGIVAVGDIANQLVSNGIKRESPIYYHTFLEVMGFNPETAGAAIARALEFKDKFEDLPLSIVPHAPYSVSKQLFDELKRINGELGGPFSMHNQESSEENRFFEEKKGGFLELYEFLGLDIGFYEPSGKSSLQTVLPYLSPELKTLLVHNTFSSAGDVDLALAKHPLLYWCLCPNANLYIENRLPDVDLLRAARLRITLGTDSLASNTGLSIFAEMQTLQNNFKIPLAELIAWGTWNGAEFLGIEDRFGSLSPGKKPGLNLLDYEEADGVLKLGAAMKKLK